MLKRESKIHHLRISSKILQKRIDLVINFFILLNLFKCNFLGVGLSLLVDQVPNPNNKIIFLMISFLFTHCRCYFKYVKLSLGEPFNNTMLRITNFNYLINYSNF